VPSIEASGALNGYWGGIVSHTCGAGRALGDESIHGGRFRSCHSD
jgi:hypothetical protein